MLLLLACHPRWPRLSPKLRQHPGRKPACLPSGQSSYADQLVEILVEPFLRRLALEMGELELARLHPFDQLDYQSHKLV